MKAEKEAEADLKIVEKEEKRASAAVGKDEKIFEKAKVMNNQTMKMRRRRSP